MNLRGICKRGGGDVGGASLGFTAVRLGRIIPVGNFEICPDFLSFASACERQLQPEMSNGEEDNF
jgi:hypothetical protein